MRVYVIHLWVAITNTKRLRVTTTTRRDRVGVFSEQKGKLLPTQSGDCRTCFKISNNPSPETWDEYYHAMQVFAAMPEDATKGKIREAITKMLMAKRSAEAFE